MARPKKTAKEKAVPDLNEPEPIEFDFSFTDDPASAPRQPDANSTTDPSKDAVRKPKPPSRERLISRL
jgi:hypothetical protein